MPRKAKIHGLNQLREEAEVTSAIKTSVENLPETFIAKYESLQSLNRLLKKLPKLTADEKHQFCTLLNAILQTRTLFIKKKTKNNHDPDKTDDTLIKLFKNLRLFDNLRINAERTSRKIEICHLFSTLNFESQLKHSRAMVLDSFLAIIDKFAEYQHSILYQVRCHIVFYTSYLTHFQAKGYNQMQVQEQQQKLYRLCKDNFAKKLQMNGIHYSSSEDYRNQDFHQYLQTAKNLYQEKGAFRTQVYETVAPFVKRNTTVYGPSELNIPKKSAESPVISVRKRLALHGLLDEIGLISCMIKVHLYKPGFMKDYIIGLSHEGPMPTIFELSNQIFNQVEKQSISTMILNIQTTEDTHAKQDHKQAITQLTTRLKPFTKLQKAEGNPLSHPAYSQRSKSMTVLSHYKPKSTASTPTGRTNQGHSVFFKPLLQDDNSTLSALKKSVTFTTHPPSCPSPTSGPFDRLRRTY